MSETTDSSLTSSVLTLRNLTTTSAVAVASSTRSPVAAAAATAEHVVYSIDLQDNPLWFGLTLLGAITLTACGIVFVKRQTVKFRDRWTCDLSASLCCRLLSDVGLYRCRGNESGIGSGAGSFNGSVSANRHDQLYNINAVAGVNHDGNGSAITSLRDDRQRRRGSNASSTASSIGSASQLQQSNRRRDRQGAVVKTGGSHHRPMTFDMLRSGNFVVDMTLRTAASVASAVAAAAAAEITNEVPCIQHVQPIQTVSADAAAAVLPSLLSSTACAGDADSSCGAVVSADDVVKFFHASYNNDAFSEDPDNSTTFHRGIALHELVATEDVALDIVTSDVDRGQSANASTSLSSVIAAIGDCARQFARIRLENVPSTPPPEIVGCEGDTVDAGTGQQLIGEASVNDRLRDDDFKTVEASDVVDSTPMNIATVSGQLTSTAVEVNRQKSPLVQLKTSGTSRTAVTSSLRLMNNGQGIDV